MTKIGDIFHLTYLSEDGKLFFKGVVKRTHKHVVKVLYWEGGETTKQKSNFLFGPNNENRKQNTVVIYTSQEHPEYFI